MWGNEMRCDEMRCSVGNKTRQVFNIKCLVQDNSMDYRFGNDFLRG